MVISVAKGTRIASGYSARASSPLAGRQGYPGPELQPFTDFAPFGWAEGWDPTDRVGFDASGLQGPAGRSPTSGARTPKAPQLNPRYGRRTGWDSNPRYPCRYGGFQDRCLQPLGHLSHNCTTKHLPLCHIGATSPVGHLVGHFLRNRRSPVPYPALTRFSAATSSLTRARR